MSFKELPLPSIASLRAVAALKSTHLALVRPARIGLGFELVAANQRALAEVEKTLGGPGRLSLPYSLRWLLDVMAGIGVLYRTLGFVHGEVQPEHVVLGEDGVGRLVPVVRAHWVRGEERPPEGLYYLAPEKLLGDGIDARADVFSAGVMLWEAISGQRLLEAYTVEDVIARLMGGGIPRARAPEGEAWSAPLASIAERAIAVDPARRFATIGEMRDAIEHVSARYLASTPGMVALFQHPEQRVRGRPRDSFAPESQRVTVSPKQSGPLEPAAQRLSRPHLSSVDLEEELTRPKVTLSAKESASIARPKPSESISPKSSLVDTLVGVTPPALVDRDPGLSEELTTPYLRLVPSEPPPASTVPASAPATRSPVPPHNPTPPYFRSPTSSLPPQPAPSSPASSIRPPDVASPVAAPSGGAAPTAAVPTAARSLRSTMSSWPPPISSVPPMEPPRPVSSRPPQAAPAPAHDVSRTMSSWPPQAAPAPAHDVSRTMSSWPPRAASASNEATRASWPTAPTALPRVIPPAAPAAHRGYERDTFDPSFESMRPRRSRALLWLALVVVAALAFFAVRPWLMRHGSPEASAPPPNAAAPPKLPPTAPPPLELTAPEAAPRAAAASAEPAEPQSATGATVPAPRVASGRGRAPREQHAVLQDDVAPPTSEPSPPEVAPPPEPEPAVTPEPTPTPEPPPPPPPPSKPKAPANDADRYGI